MYAPTLTKLTKELPYEFSESEKLKLGGQLAGLVHDIETLEAKKKESNNVLNEEIKAKNKRLVELGNNLRQGQEMRMVRCTIERNFINGMGRLVRQDTFEKVETWELTAEERQLRLIPGDDEKDDDTELAEGAAG